MVVGVWGKGGGGVSLRWISLQSSVIGLRSEQPDWEAPPFSFFLLVLFVFLLWLRAVERWLHGAFRAQHGSQIPVQPAQSARSACQDVHVRFPRHHPGRPGEL